MIAVLFHKRIHILKQVTAILLSMTTE